MNMTDGHGVSSGPLREEEPLFCSWACLALPGWFIRYTIIIPTQNRLFFFFLQHSSLIRLINNDFPRCLMGTGKRKPCSTSPKGEKFDDGMKFIFQHPALTSLKASEADPSAYCPTERWSSVMVSAQLRSSRGEMTHFMGNHCGQQVDRRAAGSLGNSKLIRVWCSGKEGHVFNTREAGQQTSSFQGHSLPISACADTSRSRRHLGRRGTVRMSVKIRKKH